MKALVINQCATNKGDRAVLYSVLQELKRNGIQDVTVSTSNPDYWEANPDYPEMDVNFVNWGWGKGRKMDPTIIDKIIYRGILFVRTKLIFPLVRNALLNDKCPGYIHHLCDKKFVEALKNSDLVISTGGHHLTTIIAKCMITPQIFDMALALIFGKPLVLWSQSIGTFDFKNPKSKPMVNKVISGAEKVFIRDLASEQEIQKLGLSMQNVIKTRESVFGLYDLVESRRPPLQRDQVMGLSVWTGNKNDPSVRAKYITDLSALANHAINAGYRLRFFPMELEGYDLPYLEDIIKGTSQKDKCEIVKNWPNTVDHINAISQCRMFVGHKTHSVVFSLLTATPLLGIAYHIKTTDFMTQFQVKENSVPDSQMQASRLVKMFDHINDNLENIGQKEEQMAIKMYECVRRDFSDMIRQLKKRD